MNGEAILPNLELDALLALVPYDPLIILEGIVIGCAVN